MTDKDKAKAVRRLNEQHHRYAAGFYGSAIGGRYFRARVRGGVFEVYDFDNWIPVPDDKIEFHDHNGHNIPLS